MAYLVCLLITDRKYIRISSGSCESNGLYSVKSLTTCESAVKHLGLSDTVAYSRQYDGRPHGCIYASNDWLSWYNSVDSPYVSALCGSTQGYYEYDCICATSGKIWPLFFFKV